MSGAIIFIQKDLKITEVQQEILVGSLSFVSILGSLAGGRASDAIGRKWTIGLAAIIFQIGAAIMTSAPNFFYVDDWQAFRWNWNRIWSHDSSSIHC